MLPTSGYFQDIDCPYYDNCCGRPYCHFRHRKRIQDPAEDHQEGEMITTGIPTYKPTPKSQLAQTKSHIPISYVPDTVIRPERTNRIYNYSDKITYKPTPLSELSKNNTINTVDIISKDLYNIANKVEETTSDEAELKDDANCDIDFEELSTEFDMIDDIINEGPSVAVNTEDFREEVTKIKQEIKKIDTCDQNNGSKSTSSKSSRSDSKSSLKSKDDISKHSKSGNSSHKSSHKSKSDKHRSRSRESSKEKVSDSKHKNDKKKDKDKDRKSLTKDKEKLDRKNDRHKSNKGKDKSSRSSSKDSKSSISKPKEKEKEHRKSKKKDKDRDKNRDSSSREKDKKESKISESKVSEERSLQYEFKDQSDNDADDNGFDDIFSDDLEEECYRIFTEYKPTAANIPEAMECEIRQDGTVEEYVPTSKKRVAHLGADQYTPKLPQIKVKPAQNAALQLTNRYKIARESKIHEENDIVALLNKHGTKRSSSILERYKTLKKARLKNDLVKNHVEIMNAQQSTSLVDDIINGRNTVAPELTYNPTPISKLNAVEDAKQKPKRIAPAMNVSSIQQAKERIAEMTKKREALSKTPIQTMTKGNKRIAHIPDTSLGELPDVLKPENKKIPVNVRTRYLTMLADECVKLYLVREDAYNRALNEELKVLERCAAIVTYRNSAMLAVNRIRKELLDRESKGLGPITSEQSEATNVDSQFKGKKFYANVQAYVLKEEDLVENGYPREGPIPGKAVIKSQKQLPRVNLDEHQRLCCRCFKVYMVDDRGFPLYEDECLYHPLKKRTLRGERLYLCCKSTEDTGCMTSNTHVSESEETESLGYQATMDPEREDDTRSSAVYSLDCEMCYTTKGLELTRVTIIDPDCKTVYESLVKPLNPIIDYNTQFSGITKEQMDRTSTSILQVQANILHLCNSRTVLIGHSLESDMKALKIIHSCVIDTAIMFPHRMGLPYKRALRTLASEYLRKIIQSDVAGHDSAEDAITCMELVIWKVKEDVKVKGTK